MVAFCHINEIPHEIREVRIAKGGVLTEEFGQVNPFRTVPAITHNGVSIYESHAILAYLATVFPVADHWYPSDPIQRAYVNSYLHWHPQNIRFGLGFYVFYKYWYTKLTGKVMAESFEEMILERQSKALKFLDEILKNHPYVAKTQLPSIADISCYCEFTQMEILNFDLNEYPHIKNWLSCMGNISGIKKAHKVWNKLIPKLKI